MGKNKWMQNKLHFTSKQIQGLLHNVYYLFSYLIHQTSSFFNLNKPYGICFAYWPR